jgi:hypothetical protein
VLQYAVLSAMLPAVLYLAYTVCMCLAVSCVPCCGLCAAVLGFMLSLVCCAVCCRARLHAVPCVLCCAVLCCAARDVLFMHAVYDTTSHFLTILYTLAINLPARAERSIDLMFLLCCTDLGNCHFAALPQHLNPSWH